MNVHRPCRVVRLFTLSRMQIRGVAAGVEVEFRRELFRDFRVGANASYMYTNVQLPEGGAYTNAQRSLQGASPYLVNADISYAPKFKNDTQLTVTLLYNLQGPRIHAVGISGLGDVKQEDLHTLDFVATYKLMTTGTLSCR